MAFQPRNDFVLVKETRLSLVNGIAMPDSAIQGKRFTIAATGPKVEDLQVGDVVFMIGKKGIDWLPLPNRDDLMICRESNVVLKISCEDEEE